MLNKPKKLIEEVSVHFGTIMFKVFYKKNDTLFLIHCIVDLPKIKNIYIRKLQWDVLFRNFNHVILSEKCVDLSNCSGDRLELHGTTRSKV